MKEVVDGAGTNAAVPVNMNPKNADMMTPVFVGFDERDNGRIVQAELFARNCCCTVLLVDSWEAWCYYQHLIEK